MSPRALVLLLSCAACAPATDAEPIPDSGTPADAAATLDAVVDGAAVDAAAGDHPRPDSAGADAAVRPDAAGGGDADWPPGPELHKIINFQPPGDPPSGAEADTGLTYSGLRGFGWSTDLSGETDRADILQDDLLDTFVLAGAAGRVDTWELVAPEAVYLVTLAAGRPDLASAPVRIVAEGVALFDAEMPLRNHYLWTVDRPIGVRDGHLTLEVGDGAGPSVLNFIEVRSAAPAGGCAARAEVCNGRDDDCDSAADEETVCLHSPACYASTLESSAALAGDGFMLRGGSFSDGGLLIDAPGSRAERSLQGNFYQGSISFEARDLLWQAPASGAACARTVFDLNHAEVGDAGRTRLILASVAPGCAGGGEGVLRLSMHSGFCCLDSAPLATVSDDSWHAIKVTWTADHAALYLDGALAAEVGYAGPSIGRDPSLWFGSGGGNGDASGATFRNLQICNEVQ